MAEYNSYIDSQIPYVGAIPSHWKTVQNKRVMHKEKRICDSYAGQDIISLTMRGAIVRDLGAGGKMPTTFDGYQYVYPGELLMCLFDIDVTPRCVGRVYNEGLTSPAYSSFVLHDNADLGYFYYYYLMLDHTKELLHLAKNLRHSLTEEQLGQIKVPLPPLVEQAAIAAYLDRETERIDAIIAEAKASIEEYKAWKTSIIYEAVTKGLDPNVKMKDSGIEWIETIPYGVHISRVGLHFDVILGKMLCPLQIDDRYSLESYFCAANVHFTGVDTQDLKQMWFSPEEKERYLVKRGDLLVVEGGAGAGGCAVYNHETENIYVQNSIMIVRGKVHSDNRYLKYLLESLVHRGYIDFVCNKATIPHFTKEKLSNVPFPVFGLQEQRRVADYLDARCAQIDSLIIEKEILISDLEAYKKSLIFEVVTGKRKVV